jgi:hypothetical protein
MDTSAIKRHLLRRLSQEAITVSDIENIADTAATASMRGESTVEITSSGFDGANSSGVLKVSTIDILQAVHDVLESVAPVASNAAPRRVFVRSDFSQPSRFTTPISQ